MIPALGCGPRPSAIRSCSQSVEQPFSDLLVFPPHEVPVHRLLWRIVERQLTHKHPVRTRYRIASTTSRRGCFSGRPPCRGGNSNGSSTVLVSERLKG